MDINELTLGQMKEIAGLVGCSAPMGHPLDGQKVVAVLPHGFIHFGVLDSKGGHLVINDASNLRYWKKRDRGLPEFAADGPSSEDKIDKIGTAYLQSVLFFYPCGDWS